MISRLLDDVPHSLVHLRVEIGDAGFTLLQLVLVFNAKDIVDQGWDCITAKPEELRLPVIDEIKSKWNDVAGGEVESGWHHDCAGLGVGKSCVVRHIVEAVEARIDVLDQQWEG